MNAKTFLLRFPTLKARFICFIAAIGLLMFGLGLNAQTPGIAGDDTINKCETKTYTISILNDSSNPLTQMVVTNNLTLLTGFSYVSGSSSINVNGGGAFCTLDPVITPGSGGGTLTWNINTLCATTFTLEDGQTLNISFQLSTDCSAVSASMNVDFNYLISGTPSSDSDAKSLQVLPGGVTIKKTPNVTPGKVGDRITWTLTVENTGLGIIENVMVTDTLGAGLQYVSDDSNGDNSGQTTIWDSDDLPALGSMIPGAIVEIDLSADIIACENLDNTADVQWGCGPGVVCFNTATDGGTATASIQHLVTTPLISFSPPDITFDYCDQYANVTMTISNIGDGAAYNLHSIVNLSEFTITNVSAGASYDGTQFILTDPLPPLADAPLNSYQLSFRVNYNSWCGTSFPVRDLLWQKVYQDGCGHDFYPPVELSQINPPTNPTGLVTAKTGGPAVTQIDSQVVYTITSSYTGPLNCGSGGAVGAVTVVDTLPAGFTPELPIAGGGVWTPGGGGTGGTVTWSYTPPATLNVTLTVNVPDRTYCDTYCYTSFTNTVSASVTDCCDCLLSATDSQTTAIECAEGVDSEKTWIAATTAERCNNIIYTNTYTFEAGSTAVLNDLLLEEQAENHQRYDGVNGPVTVLLDGGALPGGACYVITDNTSSDNGLIIDFSGCPATPLGGHTLTISYQLTIQPDTVNACTGGSFLSWTTLTMASGGGECLPDGSIHEATLVTIPAPSMSVGVTGLGQIIHKCQTQEITLTFSQTSVTPARDARLVLSGLNYYVVDPGTVSGIGITPVSGNFTPTLEGDDYVWYFGDGFTANGDTATITINVQKRCDGLGNLDATGFYDDNCTNDGVYDGTCSVSASETPALLLSGDLLIEKTPEVYYAATSTAEWTIYITNRGTGTAYNVWMDDVLGSGLLYNTATVNNLTGVTITANRDHTGAVINGATVAITEMAAGERRAVTFRADIIDCNGLTNDVTTSWGCIGVECQVARTDSATLEIPAPLLIHSNVITNPVDACSDPSGSIIVRNAGQTTCYNVTITELLPPSLLYVGASTRFRVNSGAWNGPNISYDPLSTVTPLSWDSTRIPALASLAPGDTVELDFDFSADCPFSGGLVTISTRYENPCGQVFNVADSNFNVSFNGPNVTVRKTADNDVLGCGDNVTWTIEVENTSGYELPVVWIHDILDAAYTFTGSTGDATYTGDAGTRDGQNIYWEILNLPHNGTASVTLSAVTDSSPCNANMDNNVSAYWGCGVADGLSTTHPVNDEGLCITSTSDTADNTPSRQPDLNVLSIVATPDNLDACDDSTEISVTIENNGRTVARDVDLVLTLPTGLTYISNSAAVTCGGVLTDPAPEPTIVGSTLTFYNIADSPAGRANNVCNSIDASGGNDTLVVTFSVESNCYVDNHMDIDLYYYDCCENAQYHDSGSQNIVANEPLLTVTKTVNPAQPNCGSPATWTITVNNGGAGNAQVVRVTDTIGSWLSYVNNSFTTSVPGAVIYDLGGGQYGWEFNNLAGGASATFTLQTNLSPSGYPSQADCAAALRTNSVSVSWACGTSGDATDNNPNTTNYDCSHSTPATASANLTMPDLRVTDIDVQITCSSDGVFNKLVRALVSNQGTGPVTTEFNVSVTDGTWTGYGLYNSGNLGVGATAWVTIDSSSWNANCNSCAAYSLTAIVDTDPDICECNESNNTYTETYTPAIPDLVINDIDFSNVTCANDTMTGSVRVQVRNIGCAASGGFQVSLATDGCLTFAANVGSPSVAAGGSRWLTFNISGSWSGCTDGSCDFTAAVDPASGVCECNGANNTLTETYSTTLPDLEVTDIDFSNLSCASDNISGFVRVTVHNRGYGSAANFQVSLGTDGCLTFVNQTVTATLTNGQTATVDFPVSGSLADCTDCSCLMTATVDAPNVICECDGTNNTRQETFTSTLPDLRVTAVTPAVTCNNDGDITGTVTVAVGNIGCGASGSAVVRLTSDCGMTFSDQSITLGAGASDTVVFTLPADCNHCTCNFTATIDPGNLICECNGANNSASSGNFTPNLPDVEIQDIDFSNISCSADGISGYVAVTVRNIGCVSASSIPVRLTTDGCYTFTDQTIGSLGAGGSTVLQFNISGAPADCADLSCVFTAQADAAGSICECDGDNNLLNETWTPGLPDLQITDIDFSNISCASDNISGFVRVTVRNRGYGSAANFQVSLGTDGCLTFVNQTVTATLTNGQTATVDFPVSGSLADCTDCSCLMTATVDATGVICECDGTNNTRQETFTSTLPDLRVTAVTPAVTCNNDGDITGTVTVTVDNIGCGASGSAVVRLTSDCGMTFTDQTISLGAGASNTILFTLPADCNHCNCNFTAAIDPGNLICECNGTNNSASSGNFTPNLPDLEVQNIDFTNINCSADSLTGYVAVTIRNIGCSDAVNIPVRLETDGCLTFTPQTVGLLAAGGSVTLQFNISGSLADATANSCEFTVTVDPNHIICECGGANNIFSETWHPNLPDLRITDIDFSSLCNTDSATGIVRVTVTNQGPGPSGSFQIALSTGGCLTFSTNQTVASLAAGATTTVDFTPDANWSNCATCNCLFTAVADPGLSGGAVCEGDGTNNSYSETFVGLPDLEIVSVASTIECLSDGSLTGTTVEVRNNGCAAASNVVVRLSSDCGLTFADQTITLNPGQTSSVFYPFTSGITDCSCNFTAVIDPDNAICECDGTDNTGSALREMIIPDLEIQSQNLAVDCANDGQVLISGAVTLLNNGCGGNFTGNIGVRFTLYGGSGCSGPVALQWTETLSGVNIASTGGTQTIAIQGGVFDINRCAFSINGACNFSVLIEADYTASICEWDGTDNTLCGDISSQCLDLEAVSANTQVSCVSDGVIKGSVSVSLRNIGSHPITSDFSIRLDDGLGWVTELRYNADLGGLLPIPAGGTATVVFAWSRSFDPADISCGQKTLSVLLDSGNEICQCRSDNDAASNIYSIQLANLRPTAIEPYCSADGTFTIRVTVENNGCAVAAPSTLRLRDNLGHSVDIPIDSLGAGLTTTVEFTGWPSSCDPATVIFTATVDAKQEICELNNTDNSLPVSYTQKSPDLQFLQPGIKPFVRCNAPGNFSASFEIYLINGGNSAAVTDFKIIVSDGQGWTTEKYFAADLGGKLPVAAGQAVTVRIPWNRDFSKEPFKCNFNNITARIDANTAICECAAGNNETIASYRLPFSNLGLLSVVPTCRNDGHRDLEIEITNTGCSDQTEDFNLIISDNAGKTEKRPFTQLGGVLPFKVGETRKLILTNWPFALAGVNLTLSVTLDPSGACDLTPTDNSISTEPLQPEPDLIIPEIRWNCSDSGNIVITFTVANAGGSSAAVVPVEVFDETGKRVFNDEYAMNSGNPQTYTFTLAGYTPGTPHSFRFVVDGPDLVCESNGANNVKSTVITCQSGGEPALKIGKFCPPGQGPGGLFRFEIQVENTSDADLFNLRIEDYLPAGFSYVKGSTVLGNQPYSDPSGQKPLVWMVDRLPGRALIHLYFSAVADADIDPGRYCNELAAVAARTPQGTGVNDVVAQKVQCCTVVTREPGAGCCLRLEIIPLAPFARPDGPMSFIEPYFHTGDAMLTVYAALNLWRDAALETGDMPEFMRSRLQNYALSTMEHFYKMSGLGIAFNDNSLWLAQGGSYPERDKDPIKGWRGEQTDNTMTLWQTAFELLALDSAANSPRAGEPDRALYRRLAAKKLQFLSRFQDQLPHGWEIDARRRVSEDISFNELDQYIRKLDEDATLYDRAALFLALSRLNHGTNDFAENAGRFALKLRPSLSILDQPRFNVNLKHEEFLFILALLENGETEMAKTKITAFEQALAENDKKRTGNLSDKSGAPSGPNTTKEDEKAILDTMKDFAMAAAVELKTGGAMAQEILDRMRRRFYLADTGVFADLRPDQTFKLTLHNTAALTLAIDQLPESQRNSFAITLYRTFDEVGLFLKKRNLAMGDTLYSLLKNYPFMEPFLPVLNFTKAKEDIVPVFSQDAVIHSTQLKPLGEILIPKTFSRILSPSYETSVSRIAAASTALHYFGGMLVQDGDFSLREEGRSMWDAGEKHLDALMRSGSGLLSGSAVLFPHETLAQRGPKQGNFTMEPLNADIVYNTATLADYFLAETIHAAGKGKFAALAAQLLEQQAALCARFSALGYLPQTFSLWQDPETLSFHIKAPPQRADKLTAAKLAIVFPQLHPQLTEDILKKKGPRLEAEDLIFFMMNPRFTPYFKEEIAELVGRTDSGPLVNAADVIGRKLLGEEERLIAKSLENLLTHWDKQIVMPTSDNVENIERGLIFNYQPRQVVLYLLALRQGSPQQFQFRRTLNLYTYLMENEWGVTWDNTAHTLPSSGYRVFREQPKETVEPGDFVRFKVRVDNTCPDGFVRGGDLGSLFLRADFAPPLIYAGTEPVDGLRHLADFRWRYGALASGSYLEYMFYAIAPYDFRDGFVNGTMYVGGGRGYEDFDPGSGVGDRCEDIHPVKGLRFLPFEELRGLVFEDRNADGVKSDGEAGVANILIKDTRGRVFRSDAEGRFIVLAGDEHEGLQLELRSLPPNYIMLKELTRLVNRRYKGEVYFPLIPCRSLEAFIYEDANGNNVYDTGEARPKGVVVAAREKQTVSSKDGVFMLRNLPELWAQDLAIAPIQPYYAGDVAKLRISHPETPEKQQ